MASADRQIVREILSYFAEHPDAQDTLEGIANWWLPERPAQQSAAGVKDALANLVARELILERPGRDSRSYYKVNRRKLSEISVLLKDGK